MTTKPKASHRHIPEYRVIILGAGKNIRGSLPSAMVHVDPTKRVLDWHLDAFSVLPSSEIDFVGGYMVDLISQSYPDIHFYFNSEWEMTGPMKSLSLVPLLSHKATYICYADIVFRKETIQEMEATDSDMVLAVDSQWQIRYEAPNRDDIDSSEKVQIKDTHILEIGNHIPTSKSNAQFAGLLKISGSQISTFNDLVKSDRFSGSAKLPEALNYMLGENFPATYIDLKGNWSELDAPQDLARFILGTKAESLQRLKPLVKKGTIGEIVSFTYQEWLDQKNLLTDEIQKVFIDTTLIARSSALSEDCWDASAAGAYTSVANVASTNAERIIEAVTEVFSSYPDSSPQNQVLVQEMVQQVGMSGVIMTRTPTLGAPYYVINFDDTTSRTDAVTAGDGDHIRTVFLHRKASISNNLPNQLTDLVSAVQEVELLVGHDSLDIEFAITTDGIVHILQVRPLAAAHREFPIDDAKIEESIQRGLRYFRALQGDVPFVLGKNTFFSVMTDWNPAEMIGRKPNRLAFSLYKYLITNETWAIQRAEYGYRDVRPSNLIVDFLGHPYVDVRVDFNSFIPAELSDELAKKLLNFSMEKLRQKPDLHDKVEFSILFTCLSFDFPRQISILKGSGFSDMEIASLKTALRNITINGIDRVEKDLMDIKGMEKRFNQIKEKKLPPLETAYFMLEDARRFGIPLFSHLARNAFVAVRFLHSLNIMGYIDSDQVDNFLGSVSTVSSVMQSDAAKVFKKKMSWKTFIEKYGHLRPGSYNIASPCYEKVPEKTLRSMLLSESGTKKDDNRNLWGKETRTSIEQELKSLGLDVTCDQFEIFMKRSIEGRELGKFIFMKNVNAALEALAEFGEIHGVSREDISHLRIHDLLDFRAGSSEKTTQALLRLSKRGKESYVVTQASCLPAILMTEEDFTCMEQHKAVPNYVTRKKVRASVVALSKETTTDQDFSGKIVAIPCADPGFDWIFVKKIAGLITMYGGLNSHMAIRAAEFQLPAAIGVGEAMFEKIKKADVLELDCSGRTIKILI